MPKNYSKTLTPSEVREMEAFGRNILEHIENLPEDKKKKLWKCGNRYPLKSLLGMPEFLREKISLTVQPEDKY